MIDDGRYTLIYPSGDYRTLQAKTVSNRDSGLAGKQILSIKEGDSFIGVAFLVDGKARFWRRFKDNQSPDRLLRIQRALDRIAAAPEVAGLAYALKENRCCRCGKELTVPASIHHGMGAECAKKRPWRKSDQQLAYEWAKEGAVA